MIYYKIIFVSTMIIGTIISISSYSWIGIWIGLEINLLSIIPLIERTKNIIASEAALKYFITQAVASTLLIFSIIIISLKLIYTINLTLYFRLIFNTSLLTKIGAAPFHFWFPEVIEGLNWSNSLIILTWQKIAPIVLLTYNNQNILYLALVIIFRIIIRGLIGINQTRLRKIMAYSSINHIGWIIGSIIVIETIWIYYFVIYRIITANIVLIFKNLNIFHVNQLYISINQNIIIKFFFVTNFLSLGGLPPFLGFIPKWLTVQTLAQRNLHTISIIIILITLITLYFYMQVTFSTILLSKTEIKYYTNPQLKTFWTLAFNWVTIVGLITSTFLFNYI